MKILAKWTNFWVQGVIGLKVESRLKVVISEGEDVLLGNELTNEQDQADSLLF